MPKGLFPIKGWLDKETKLQKTGEVRNPKSGEWFLEGHLGYQAANNLIKPRPICRLVRVHTRMVTDVVEISEV